MLLGAMKRMIDSNNAMVAAATGIASGDLRVRVTPRSERDTLGQALANMIARLTEIIGEVRSGAARSPSPPARSRRRAQSLSQGTSQQAAVGRGDDVQPRADERLHHPERREQPARRRRWP